MLVTVYVKYQITDESHISLFQIKIEIACWHRQQVL